MTIGRRNAITAAAIVVETVESEMLIDFVVRWLLMLDQGRIGDVGRIEMGFAIGTAAAVGAGRERSQHVRTVRLRVERRLIERRVIVRIQIFAGRSSLRHGLVGIHHEATLAVVLMLKLLTAWMVSMWVWM